MVLMEKNEIKTSYLGETTMQEFLFKLYDYNIASLLENDKKTGSGNRFLYGSNWLIS